MAVNQNYWQANLCVEMKPVPNMMVIFGASGDLTKRKLIPALFNLYRRELFHESSRIVGFARTELAEEEFRGHLHEFLPKDKPEEVEKFLAKVHYVYGEYDSPEAYQKLNAKFKCIEEEMSLEFNRTFYLSTPAALYPTIVPQLAASGLTEENFDGKPWRHVILEKPFGYDTDSAEELDRMLHENLQERQIYRIDHYLGKETVQNILMLRFANIIFEPIWNNTYIDHVQITAAETVGVENRAGYYDKAGQLRDMFQNHMLAMLSLVAMEVPVMLDADGMRDEQLKLIRSIRPFPLDELDNYIMRAQYAANDTQPGYRQERGVNPNLQIETYAAAKLFINNWRWRGVPFYLRSGKRLKRRLSEIAITFKHVPHSIFPQLSSSELEPDVLVLNVQPEEGMALTIQAKQPGPRLCMGKLTLNFNYADAFGGNIPEAYERLLLDCMLGDQTLFIRSDIIAASWRLFTPVLKAWEQNTAPLYQYKAGSDGPEEANRLFGKTGYYWRDL